MKRMKIVFKKLPPKKKMRGEVMKMKKSIKST